MRVLLLLVLAIVGGAAIGCAAAFVSLIIQQF